MIIGSPALGIKLPNVADNTASAGPADNRVIWFNRGLELSWLLVVVLVPLAFLGRHFGEWSSVIGSFELPKLALLRSLVALMVALWLVKWSLQGQLPLGELSKARSALVTPREWLHGPGRWLAGGPTRWLTLTALLYLATTLLTTVLSASFDVSFWGDAPGQDGYSAHTVIAYVLLFGMIATQLKTQAQMHRLLWAITLMAVLVAGYGVFQHYGWDFLDLKEPPDTDRVSSTMGNSGFAGSLLLLTIPLCLMWAVIRLHEPVKPLAFWCKLALWSSVLAVLLLGMTFTLSRGPWVGAAAALIVFLGLTLFLVGWRPFVRAALVLGIAAAMAAAVIQASEGGPSQPEDVPSTASATVQRITAVSGAVGAAGLAGRVQIWQGAKRLVTGYPWYAFDTLNWSSLRPLIGYGPEMFRPAYLLESRPTTAAFLPGETDHAHNFVIHQTVEQGFLGLVTSAGLLVMPFVVGGYLFLRRKSNYSTASRLLLIGLLAAFVGRVLEQMVGVARVSDLTLFWVLLAAFAALPDLRQVCDGVPDRAIGNLPGSPQGHRIWCPPGATPAARRRNRWQFPGVAVIVAVVIVGMGTLIWFKTINYVRAAVVADQAAEQFRHGDLDAALAAIDTAIDLAPDVSTYYSNRASVYFAARGEEVNLGGLKCRQPGELRSYELCLAERVHSGNLEWLDHRPLDVRARLAAAGSALQLGLLNHDDSLVNESIQRFREAAEMVPNSYIPWNLLAEVYIQVGRPEAALPVLERSLAITSGNNRSYFAFRLQAKVYLATGQVEQAMTKLQEAIDVHYRPHEAYAERGLIYSQYGQLQKALAEFDQAIRIASNVAQYYYERGSTYYNLARYQAAIQDLDEALRLSPELHLAYNDRGLARAQLGEFQRALDDFNQVIRLDPASASWYNNRGFAHRNLGQAELAIQDLNEAIRLDPQLGIAYFNRALANNLLGRDTDAVLDMQRAADLGFDPKGLDRALKGLKTQR